MKIESLTNARVKDWVKLQTKKERDNTGLFLVEGEHLIEEAKKQNLIKEIISINETLTADFYVTKEIMKKISMQVTPSERVAVCYKKKEEKIANKILLLDGIGDPGNLGTILRSAVAFGFTDIILSQDSVDLYNEKVIRASEGMIFHVNVLRKDLASFLEEIKGEYTIYMTDVKKGENIRNISLKEKIALMIGNEGSGIKEELKPYGNVFLKIPMNSNCESLNAGVSASILMYEIMEKFL